MRGQARRILAAALVLSGALAAAVTWWAFTTGRPAVGIAVLLAVCVLPGLIRRPGRIRDSRRRADEARARRGRLTPDGVVRYRKPCG